MTDENWIPPTRGLIQQRARQSAGEILRELSGRVGNPDQRCKEGRLPSTEALEIAYKQFSPELAAIYHDTLGLLRAIADGQIPPGQPRIASNLIQIVTKYTSQTSDHNVDAVGTMLECLVEAGEAGISAERTHGQAVSLRK